MKQWGDSEPFFQNRADREVAHPQDCEGIIGKGNRIAAGFDQRLCSGKILVERECLRWIQLANDYPFSLSHPVEEIVFGNCRAGGRFRERLSDDAHWLAPYWF